MNRANIVGGFQSRGPVVAQTGFAITPPGDLGQSISKQITSYYLVGGDIALLLDVADCEPGIKLFARLTTDFDFARCSRHSVGIWVFVN